MALKDWKKARKGNYWSKVNSSGRRIIVEISSEFIGSYDVKIYGTFGSGYSLIKREDFKTKSKALAYAKAYMIKH